MGFEVKKFAFFETGELPQPSKEVETKVLSATVESHGPLLEAHGMMRGEAVTLTTFWFDNDYLPDGVTARIRVERTASGAERFFVAIKDKRLGREEPSPTGLTKARYETEWETENLMTGNNEIRAVLHALYEDTELSLIPGETTVKRRVSYVCGEAGTCVEGACAGVRFDFDEIVEHNGRTVSPAVQFLEIESTSESAILECVDRIGIPRTSLDAETSTRALIAAQIP